MGKAEEIQSAQQCLQNILDGIHPASGKKLRDFIFKDPQFVQCIADAKSVLDDLADQQNKQNAKASKQAESEAASLSALCFYLAEEKRLADHEAALLKEEAQRNAPQVPGYFEIVYKKHERIIPIIKGKIRLDELSQNLNTALASLKLSISATRLQSLCKESALIAATKVNGQIRYVPTKLGEYHGFSIGNYTDETGVTKSVPKLNESAQLFVLQLISEKSIKKQPFTFIPGVLAATAICDEESSLPDLLDRINTAYALENMTKLSMDAMMNALCARGVFEPGEGEGSPSFVPAADMRRNGIVFYEAEGRFPARSMLTERGQRFIIKELSGYALDQISQAANPSEQ